MLPEKATLDSWADLEASALKELHLLRDDRLVAILHADDPVLLSSSVGDLSNINEILHDWAYRHRASFHADRAKSIVLPIVAGLAKQQDFADVNVSFKTGPKGNTVTHKLQVAIEHKWLGILWSSRLDFSSCLR